MDFQDIFRFLSSESGQVFVVLGAIVLACVLAGIVLRMVGPGRYPYRQRGFLFTPAERSFMQALQQAIGHQYWIAGQVRMADVLQVHGVRREKKRWKAFTKISSKHLDYVLCSPRDYRIVAAIELDDSSHREKDRTRRDVFVDKACESAGLPLMRFRAQKSYSPVAIRTEIQKTLGQEGRRAA